MASIQDEFDSILQNMRRRSSHVLLILVATLTHDVPEQHAALSCIDEVV
jgi:hypothetical protein